MAFLPQNDPFYHMKGLFITTADGRGPQRSIATEDDTVLWWMWKMECPHCQSSAKTQRPETMAQRYRRFRYRACERRFNERTGLVFKCLQYLPEVGCLMVLWRVHYK